MVEANKLTKILENVGDLNYKRRIQQILKYLDIQPGDHVLDCGCGDGFYTMIVSELYDCKITAADFNQVLLDRAADNIKNKDRVTFVRTDFLNGVPFPDNTFDKIIFTEVLEHLENEVDPLLDLQRVLKPGGKLAVTVPSASYPFLWDPLNWTLEHLRLGHINPKSTTWGGVWSYDHKRLYTPEHLKDVLAHTSLRIDEMYGLTHYTLPFNLHLLSFGKSLYSNLPLPKTFVSSVEKFDWESEQKNMSVLSLPFALMRKIDSMNSGKDFIGKKSFITLFCGVSKNAG